MRRVLAFIVVAVVAGGLIGWWATRSKTIEVQPTPVPSITEDAPASTNAAGDPAAGSPHVSAEIMPEVTATNWEDRLDDILGSDKMDEDQKADKLADMIPNLPENAQIEIVPHLANLIADEHYAKAAAILKDEKMPAPVGQVLLDDLFNRDDALKMPLVLELAKNENHPLKAPAREMLEQLTQEDHGTNWQEWTATVEKMLKPEGQ